MSKSRRLASLAAVVALGSVMTGSASAQQPKSGAAAIQQYVESIPTGSGPAVPGITASEKAALPSAALEALRYAPPPTARALATIATSSAYGAPHSSAAASPSEPSQPSTGDAVWRSLDTVGTASDARLLALVVILACITVGAGAVAARRTLP